MKKKPQASKTKKVDWAAKVHKFKPQLNALTGAERRRLFKEALADINSAEATVAHVRLG